MSKSQVHIRVSEKEYCLNEHEIFEMMRSRTLYQMQFDLRRKLEKRIRAIELAEKVHMSTFRSRKTVFLNKVKEKIRQKNPVKFSQEFDIRELYELDREFEKMAAENEDQVFETVAKAQSETLRNSIRSKSLANIMALGEHNNPERPVTSRSLVSLNGKSLPVAKSSSRQKPRENSKTLVTEMTMYPDDFIGKLTVSNNDFDILSSEQNKHETKCTKPRKEKRGPKILRIQNPKALKDRPMSLPPINKADNIKTLATFEMGTLTPDGSLLLTRDDYNRYMDKFSKKRERRLHRTRRLSKSLDQRVREFRIIEETSEC